MVIVALIYDGLQALIDLISVGTIGWLVNPFINFWSFLTFWFWFKLKGLSFAKPNKALTMGGSFLLEFFPVINSLPAWTSSVIILLAITYAEDVAGSISPLAAQALATALGDFKNSGTGKFNKIAAIK
ncbi:MAG: hypothetical protein WC893_00730 [Candidatus Paceibacterota bacterium]|jgi:hypothetical protein